MKISYSIVFGLFSLTALVQGCSHTKTKSASSTPPAANSAPSELYPWEVYAPGPNAKWDIPKRREFPINEKVSACENFYVHTCSKVEEGFKLRDDRSRHVFAFSDSSERILEAKKKFFENLAHVQAKTPRLRALKNVYLSCMNVSARQAEERSLTHRVAQELQSIQNNQDFQKYLGTKILSADFSFLGLIRDANLDDPSKWDAIFAGSLQSLPERSYYDRQEVISDYLPVIEDFFATLGDSDPKASAKAVIAFETEFSKSYPLPAEWREIETKRHPSTREELVKNYPSLELASALRSVPAETPLRDMVPANFKWLNDAIRTQPIKTLKAVYLFHSLKDWMDDAYPEFFDRYFAFRAKHLGGTPARPPRQERCTRLVMGRFNKEVDAELLPQLFPHFPEKRFTALAEKVRATIASGIQKNKWLSPEAKAAAYEKITQAGFQLVKPRTEEEWDFNPVAEYSPTQPITNLQRLSENKLHKLVREFNKKRSSKVWYFMGPLIVNAYYSPEDNKFVMPIGILQPPFYDPKLSDEANFGGVGAVIGHELGHSIDDQGSQFDSQGKLRTWMKEQDLAEFKARSGRMVEQFNTIRHNGTLTLGENIGDLVGLTFAYEAAFPGGIGELKKRQDFFYQFGRLWCTVERPSVRELLLKTDPHSLGWARVNQQVKNQRGFEEVFGCKAGDPMTLPDDQRVRVW